jgi:phosphotriesterase-related protein
MTPAHYVMTATGRATGDQLGPTSVHEHLYCDISVHSGREDNNLTDVPLMVGELAYLRCAGGRTVVDVTPEGIGRYPAMLKAISEGSGVQVVSGIAFYTEETYPVAPRVHRGPARRLLRAGDRRGPGRRARRADR